MIYEAGVVKHILRKEQFIQSLTSKMCISFGKHLAQNVRLVYVVQTFHLGGLRSEF